MKNKDHDTLSHYGVIGMKWGVRKKRPSVPDSNDHKALSMIKKKKLKDMSDDELRTAAKRMRLIKQYRASSSLVRGKKISKMTNEEIKTEINRSKLRTAILKDFLKTDVFLSLRRLRDVGKMNDAQINAALKRHILEKDYKDLNREDITAAAKLLKEVIFDVKDE